MTEAEWLNSIELGVLLFHLGQRASKRKRRLFNCACCRRGWHLLRDKESRRAVDTSERFAAGLVSAREVHAAAVAAERAAAAAEEARIAAADEDIGDDPSPAYLEAEAAKAAAEAAAAAARAPHGYYLDWSEVPRWMARAEGAWLAARAESPLSAQRIYADFPDTKWQRYGCHLLRELFGNPFRPVSVREGWMTSNGGGVRQLGRAIYAERAFDRLPILADALEEAGCEEASLLAHCRGGGEHVRGCWAVGAVLGKS